MTRAQRIGAPALTRASGAQRRRGGAPVRPREATIRLEISLNSQHCLYLVEGWLRDLGRRLHDQYDSSALMSALVPNLEELLAALPSGPDAAALAAAFDTNAVSEARDALRSTVTSWEQPVPPPAAPATRDPEAGVLSGRHPDLFEGSAL